MTRFAVALLASSAVLVSTVATRPDLSVAIAGEARTCPKGLPAVAQNDFVRVYKVRDRHSRRGYEVDACSRTTRERYPIDLPPSGIYAFLGPSISLRGPLVGYAQQVCGPDGRVDGSDGGSCFSTVKVRNFDIGDDVNASPAGPPGRSLVKVGSLRVKANGSVAWIACPERHRKRAIGRRGPNCVRPGDFNYVLADQGGSRRRPLILARGRGIDPDSLRLAGSTLSWNRNGRRVRAKLR